MIIYRIPDITVESLISNDTAPSTLTLPPATGTKTSFVVKNINTGAVTVVVSNGETIDGELSQVVYQWEAMHVLDYAVGQWLII